MKCTFCKQEVSGFNKWKDGNPYLLIARDSEDHCHVHGTVDDKPSMEDLLFTTANELNIPLTSKGDDKKLTIKEAVFHNRQRIGDILMMTCGIRDFKVANPNVRVNIVSTAMHIWDHNPYIDTTLVPTKENTYYIGPGKLTNSSNRLDWHFANAYRVSIEDALKISIPQGDSRPDIWFTQEEYESPRITPNPYWIIVIGGERGWGCKMYPFDRWQEFVNQNPDTLFYQLGTLGDNHPRLKGDNVVDYIGKTESKDTGIRDLFKLFLNAEGSIGLVSFHMHLSGALHKPSIVIAGAREPVSFTRYAGHRYLANDGCLGKCSYKNSKVTACWHCDIKSCEWLVDSNGMQIPKCVDMIHPEDLTRALNQYYIGGRLEKGKASIKPRVNIAKEAKLAVAFSAPPKDKKEEPKVEILSKFGIPFGNTEITSPDWSFISPAMDEYKIKTVLEFGCGLSTLLMAEKATVTSFENDLEFRDRIIKFNSNLNIFVWDGVSDLTEGKNFDMAFVDAPRGGMSREYAIKIASERARVVIVHDAGRIAETKWQDMYLKSGFEGPIKGGTRTSIWLKKSLENVNINLEVQKEKLEALKLPSIEKLEPSPQSLAEENECKSTIVCDDRPLVKIVSTARGWGGCARSVTTIMKYLLKSHRVEFIPFRNSVGSREYAEMLRTTLKDVKVTPDYTTIRDYCDVFFMYADDYIWEFNKPNIVEAFSTINAGKKIMMLNYRRGPVGEVEWTKGWDKYMFLNSTQEAELLRILPGVNTKVLPPCTELDEFLKITPNYRNGINIVRHNSQGDIKFIDGRKEKEEVERARVNQEISSVLSCRNDVTIHMLPGPSFIPASEKFIKYGKTDNPSKIAEFLAKGNLFWYSLPVGYMDMGPRVVLEAMAAGIPILADNWGGVIDRVTSETGWLVGDKSEFVKIISELTPEELEKKGIAARERAKSEFVLERWISEIVE